MIRTFKNKALEKLFKEGNAKGIPKEFEKKIRVRLEVIDTAIIIDINIQGYRLHELTRAYK